MWRAVCYKCQWSYEDTSYELLKVRILQQHGAEGCKEAPQIKSAVQQETDVESAMLKLLNDNRRLRNENVGLTEEVDRLWRRIDELTGSKDTGKISR